MRSRELAIPIRATVLCLCLFLLVGCGRRDNEVSQVEPPDKKAAPAPDKAVVTVNGVKLMQSDFEQRVTRRLDRNRDFIAGLGPEAREMAKKNTRKSVVEHFINTTLLMAEAHRRNLDAPIGKVEAVINQMRSRVPEGQTFESALQKQGTTEAAMRERLKRELAISELKKRVEADGPKVTDAEILQFYETEKANYIMEHEYAAGRHILVSVPEDADKATKAARRKVAAELRAKLVAGADFASLAEKHSDDKSSSDLGGNLGKVRRGAAAGPLDKALFSQEIDAIGPVIESPAGFHIVQVLKRAPEKLLPLEHVREQITQRILKAKSSRGFAEFVEDLRARADIVYGDVDID